MRRSLVAVLLTATAGAVAVAGPAQATVYGHHDVHGVIEQEYLHLGGPQGFLKYPTTNEKGCTDGVGRYNYFQGGAIYYTPSTSAHEVHGVIRSKWLKFGGYAGVLGYPTQDQEATAPKVGQFSVFQIGSIYSSAASGTHEVQGAIRDEWASLGYENSQLGFPTGDEKATMDGGRRSNFQGGYIVWHAATGAVVHYS